MGRLVKGGFIKDGEVPESLYNLDNDVWESTNVIDKHHKVAARLRKLAKEFDAELRKNRRPIGKLYAKK
jgi:hypothetical protein